MKYWFGDKIRTVRERKKITMKELGERAGVSESLISQIERNKVSPAIDTLLSIAEILEIDIEYLFSDLKINKQVNLVKKNDRKKIYYEKVKYEQLSKTIEKNEEHGIEAYFMRIEPEGHSGSNEYGHTGKELGVIISGKGEFSIGSNKFLMEEGDSISFDSSVPHILKNIGDSELVAFWVITPPKKFSDSI